MLKRIGSYEILGVLGEGGMGTVYLGRDPRFDRTVAIKVLHEQFQRDPGVVERFRSEAVIQAKLNHPNIVTVHDFVADQTILAIVMENVEGQPLSELIEGSRGPLPVPRALRLMDQVLSAMSHAHARGLVHRDIKPSNILVQRFGSDEVAKVMDFGIAKILGAEKQRTATAAKMGTLAYMSPEHVQSPKGVDARSDIYSLGVVLYEMLTGRAPFDADSEYELMRQIVREPAPDPRLFAPTLRAGLPAVVARALTKDPAGRFQSCEEMRAALSQAAQGEATRVAASPAQTVESMPPSKPPSVPVPAPAVAAGVEKGKRANAPWFVAASVVLAALGIGLTLAVSRAPSAVSTRSPSISIAPAPQAPGTLVVRLDPPAIANLEGWQAPDAGQRVASTHTFSGLEARTYRLKVWREGHGAESRNVSVLSGKTTTVDVALQR